MLTTLILLFTDFGGFRLFTGFHGLDLTQLLGLGLRELTLEFENRFARFYVLLFNYALLVALDIVRKLLLLSGEMSDLLNTFGIEDIVRV